MTVLLIKDVPDLPEDFDDVDATSEWCSNKSALLFPLSLMTSYIWKLVCNMTEQKELYTLANVEAPSGVPLKIQIQTLNYRAQLWSLGSLGSLGY